MEITTANRVVRNTAPAVTQRILKRTESRLEYYERHPNEIPARLRELDREWDVERTLETGSASLTLLGLILGTTVNKKWFLLSAGVQGFFLQHSIQGWCPPLPLLRNLGVRTTQEIERERHALLGLWRV
jgi:hypothetical protein